MAFDPRLHPEWFRRKLEDEELAKQNKLIAVVERVACLNKDTGIGLRMLASLVDEAKEALEWNAQNCKSKSFKPRK